VTEPLSPVRTAPCPGVRRSGCSAYRTPGGSARVFHDWHRYAPPGVEVVPLEPAGRGTRTRELPAQSVQEGPRLRGEVRAVAGSLPYALLGHSMGSLIAYEMAAAGPADGLPGPALVVVSGRNPPHCRPVWPVGCWPCPTTVC
jgi:surfactin synthase thioesterase subunit